MKKQWNTQGSDSPCEFCQTRFNDWYPVDDVMIKKGDTINGVDGGVFVNNWDNNEGHSTHCGCHCVPIYRVMS